MISAGNREQGINRKSTVVYRKR